MAPRINKLEDVEAVFADLTLGFETLLGVQAAYLIVLSAIIAKHPDQDQLKLVMTGILEQADMGAFAGGSDRQRSAMRETVEQLLRTAPVIGQIRPLG